MGKLGREGARVDLIKTHCITSVKFSNNNSGELKQVYIKVSETVSLAEDDLL